jgi:formylmethanofuran dehydrogenase subunit A
MLKLTFGVARANSSEVFRRTKSREGHLGAGAKVEVELARAKPAQAETTREQRALRGVTADREGKALKATRNPMGGCGAKQSHKARAGSNR